VALAARDRLMKFASRPVKGRDETELDRIGSISKTIGMVEVAAFGDGQSI
jgi:hypothetical protein